MGIQIHPSVEEGGGPGTEDPLNEDACSPVPGLIHVYPNRVLLMPTQECFVHCRHCNRRWKRDGKLPSPGHWSAWFKYLADRPEATEVLITGGDPLTLTDGHIQGLLAEVRAVMGEGVIRIGTRAPVVAPERITKSLVRNLASFHPLYLHTQFNCPEECTSQAAEALDRLADAGINLGNQMVLLQGVNDSAERIVQVNEWLVRHRCRPYYVFVTEPVKGTSHLWVSLARAKELSRELRRRLSGIAMPLVVQDQPSGGGKVPVELL